MKKRVFERLPPKIWAGGKIRIKMAPRLLNDDQKEHHMLVHHDIIEHLHSEQDLLLSSTRKPSSRAVSGSLRRRRDRRMQVSQKSVLLITFHSARSIVHGEFLSQELAIIQQVYKEVLWCTLRLMRGKIRELW